MIIWITVGILVLLGAFCKWYRDAKFHRLSRAESPRFLVKSLAVGGNGSSLIIGVSRDSWLIEVIKVGRDSPGSLMLAVPILGNYSSVCRAAERTPPEKRCSFRKKRSVSSGHRSRLL